jgi:hypothetical protein
MANVHYVASYTSKQQGGMTMFEPQGLVSQTRSCSFVWSEEPLSTERIETWTIGPVVPDLCARRHPMCTVYTDEGGKRGEEAVDGVPQFPLNQSSRWLARLTHQADARRGARDSKYTRVVCNQEITQAAMAYRSSPLLRTGDGTGHSSNAVRDLPLCRLSSMPSKFGPELRPSARAARTSP